MRTIVAIALCLFCMTVDAQMRSYRAGSHVVSLGDSEASLASSMGQPARRVDITNSFGKKIGEQWIYEERSKTVYFVVAGGQVTSMEEVRK